jgi:hypothetical protein
MAQYRLNANIPPIPFSIEDLDLNPTDQLYATAVRAIRGYHRQAVNMTKQEQMEYITMLLLGEYKIHDSAVKIPVNYKVYKACKKEPTWPRYVVVNSIHNDAWDNWIPKPQLAEKREDKRNRGWVWSEDPIGRKEMGKRSVRYGGMC